jgi:hypothetical protein
MTDTTQIAGTLATLDEQRSVFVGLHEGDVYVKFTNGDYNTPIRLSQEAARAAAFMILRALPDDQLD